MVLLTVSEYLDSNPLTEQQTREFLQYALQDNRLSEACQRIREICTKDYSRRNSQENEELEELHTFVSNSAIKFGKGRQMSATAIGFLMHAVEQNFLMDEYRSSAR